MSEAWNELRWDRRWLEGAEASFSLSGLDARGVSFFFNDAGPFHDFARALGPMGRRLREHDAAMRDRFDLAPRRWVKRKEAPPIHFSWSQYFQLSPRWSDYPLTTLRVFLRMFGSCALGDLEEALRTPLSDPTTVWGLALKYSAGPAVRAPRPVFSFTTPPERLHTCVTRLTVNGFVDSRAAAECLARVKPLLGDAAVFVSLDPGRPGGPCVVDLPDIRHALLPHVNHRVPLATVFRYVKCRVAPPSFETEWTAYLPLGGASTSLV